LDIGVKLVYTNGAYPIFSTVVLYVTGEKTQEREELYYIVLKKLKLL
jgi:hypothetical protein